MQRCQGLPRGCARKYAEKFGGGSKTSFLGQVASGSHLWFPAPLHNIKCCVWSPGDVIPREEQTIRIKHDHTVLRLNSPISSPCQASDINERWAFASKNILAGSRHWLAA